MHISPPGSHHRRNILRTRVYVDTYCIFADDVGNGVSFAEPSGATLKGVSVKRRIEFITPARRGEGWYTQPPAISQEWIFLYTAHVFSPDNGKWHYCYSICFFAHTLITLRTGNAARYFLSAGVMNTDDDDNDDRDACFESANVSFIIRSPRAKSAPRNVDVRVFAAYCECKNVCKNGEATWESADDRLKFSEHDPHIFKLTSEQTVLDLLNYQFLCKNVKYFLHVLYIFFKYII